MKRISILWLMVAVCAAPLGRAQDAATQERLDQLAGKIDDILGAQERHRVAIAELGQRVEGLREQVNKPAPPSVTPDGLRRLADSMEKAIKDVDRRRVQDNESIQQQIREVITLINKMAARPVEIHRSPPPEPVARPEKKAPEVKAPEERGIKHVVKEGETLSAIVAACRAKQIKVTQDQIVKANPGLRPDRIRPGMEIFIPVAPAPQ